jgi:transcriptional regulator with XRE-family HTH domain
MEQPVPHEGESAIIVSLSEASMHMYAAAIDALPFPEDKKFHKRAEVVLSGLRKLRAALTEAAARNRPSASVVVAVSEVRRRYDTLMTRAAAAPGSSLGQQLYSARIQAKLSAEEVANGAGLRADLIDDLEAGETPTEEETRKLQDVITALGGVPGAEHLVHQEPAHDDEDDEQHHEESNVNGWDEGFVDNAANN